MIYFLVGHWALVLQRILIKIRVQLVAIVPSTHFFRQFLRTKVKKKVLNFESNSDPNRVVNTLSSNNSSNTLISHRLHQWRRNDKLRHNSKQAKTPMNGNRIITIIELILKRSRRTAVICGVSRVKNSGWTLREIQEAKNKVASIQGKVQLSILCSQMILLIS